ncbi:MAG: hypothetical protein ACKVRP_06125 [Bacteroidota bacterium]
MTFKRYVLIAISCLPGLFACAQSDTTVAAQQDSAAIVQADTLQDLPDFEVIEDRWRKIKPPPYELNVDGSILDPYNQNILKGDYPILGQNTFLVLTATSDNLLEAARAPTPSGVSALDPGSLEFFGRGERFFASANIKLGIELYQGDVAFRPRDWELKVTTVFNYNYVKFREHNAVNFNVKKGDHRGVGHVGFQELSVEKHLFDVSDRYDFVSLKLGIQPFGSDFRRFIFADYNLGARLLGSFANNRFQYNLIFLPMLEKETNSELNTVFDDREQDVLIANLYIQDFATLGYTTQFSFHYNHDKPTLHFDENGFPVRPAVIGNVRPHEITAYYLGWAGDGHFGRLNISHALYYAFGEDDFNSIAGRSIDLSAMMGALELSYDKDWMRFKASVFWASGDKDPMDDAGEGFDAILDQPFFAGGPFSYWNGQGIRLQGVGLVQKQSLLPSLRSSKIEGQANFVNPGLWLFNLGYDAELTPKFKALVNVNYLRFAYTSTLENFVNQPAIGNDIGFDCSLGLIYRPFLNNNSILSLGVSTLLPGEGFEDLYQTTDMQFAVFTSLVFTY